ncbi:hypothetical protein C4D60_Mb01t24410 [Musa balbisiana]|uniref:Uncharacterized protein n=1 Tax=Musa balbisiana TaxID=52838 RepID=A0A4S8JQQ5_MUSBA|nr:hypothetical protein C4D60_Mb01t24410 [Musa balbisiana]
MAVPRCGELARVRGEPDGCDRGVVMIWGSLRELEANKSRNNSQTNACFLQVIDTCVALSDDFGSRDWTMCIITPALYQIM